MTRGRRVSGKNVAVAILAGMLVLLLAAPCAAAGAKALRIGVVPSESVKVLLLKYQPLMDYLSQKLGTPVEIQPARSYDEIVDALRTGAIDGGIFGSFVAWKAIREIGAVPVARPEKDGVSSYRGFVIVRKDSGFRKIDDLRGKSFDYVSKSTSAGFVYPLALLKERKLDPATFFSASLYGGQHDTAVMKVLNRQADGAAVKDTVFRKLAASDPRIPAEITVIHTSGAFPDSTVVMRRDLPPETVKVLRKALLAMREEPGGRDTLRKIGVDRYIATDRKDFDELAKLMKAVEGK